MTWLDHGPTVVSNEPMATPMTPPAINGAWAVNVWGSRDETRLVTWQSTDPRNPTEQTRRFFGLIDEAENVTSVYDTTDYEKKTSVWIYPRAVIGEGRVLALTGIFEPETANYHPALAIINLEAAAISVIPELSSGYPHRTGPTAEDAMLVNGLARVSIPGDCLNVRAEASLGGEVVGCVADGVLVEVTGGVVEADGVEWKRVRLPGGNEGWVSGTYVAE